MDTSDHFLLVSCFRFDQIQSRCFHTWSSGLSRLTSNSLIQEELMNVMTTWSRLDSHYIWKESFRLTNRQTFLFPASHFVERSFGPLHSLRPWAWKGKKEKRNRLWVRTLTHRLSNQICPFTKHVIESDVSDEHTAESVIKLACASGSNFYFEMIRIASCFTRVTMVILSHSRVLLI